MTRQNEPPRQTTSSSMEEVAACPPKLEGRRRAKRPEEVRAPAAKNTPHGARPSRSADTPPQSALRADSSSIEEERGARAWLRQRAKAMRKDMTPHEKAMWRLLHEGELVALYWRRQARFGKFILDFVSHPARLVIEVDGAQHGMPDQREHDEERTAALKSEGYRVLRFWNNETLSARDGVWRTIHAAAMETPARARVIRWREKRMQEISEQNERATSSSMEEVAAKRPEEVRAPAVKNEPREAAPSTSRASPPQSALRADSSSIEEERS
jgi:very-short-patch-repair endonuclease